MESLALRDTIGGPDVSRRPKTASADRHVSVNLVLYCLTAWSHERGRFLPTALYATEPLTPLSRASVHPHASPSFPGSAVPWPRVRLLDGVTWVGGCGDRLDHR